MAGVVGVLTNYGISSIDFPSNSTAAHDRVGDVGNDRVLNGTGTASAVDGDGDGDGDATMKVVAERLTLLLLPLTATFLNFGEWTFYVDMLCWYDR